MMLVNEVVHLKLRNGENIVAFVSGDNETEIQMEFPALLAKVDGGYQFTKWFPFSVNKHVYHVDKSNVMSWSDVTDDVKHNYILYAVQIGNRSSVSPDEANLDFDEFIEDLDDSEEPSIH